MPVELTASPNGYVIVAKLLGVVALYSVAVCDASPSLYDVGDMALYTCVHQCVCKSRSLVHSLVT